MSIVDPAFGTGAVKVTAAHDPNDFEMAVRHSVAQLLSLLDAEHGIMDGTNSAFDGIGSDLMHAVAVVEATTRRTWSHCC